MATQRAPRGSRCDLPAHPGSAPAFDQALRQMRQDGVPIAFFLDMQGRVEMEFHFQITDAAGIRILAEPNQIFADQIEKLVQYRQRRPGNDFSSSAK